jgi:integrase
MDAVRRLVENDALPAWEHRSVTDLDRRDVLDVIDGVVDRGSPITARRLHAHLHRFFKWCAGRGIIVANPMTDLPKPGNETKRDRVLSDKELVAVWKVTEKLGWPFGSAFQLLMLTGARLGEIGQLRWSEIVGREICLSGARTKNGEPHTIPLSAAALTVIHTLPRIGDSDLVLTTTGETPVSGWSKAKQQIDALAKIPPWRTHDLRRTVATGLQRLGVGLQTIEAVLGHVSGSRSGVVGVYQRHSFDVEKAAALETWGAHVFGLLDGRTPGKVVATRRR